MISIFFNALRKENWFECFERKLQHKTIKHAIKDEKRSFLLVFLQQNYILDLGNVTVLPNFVYNSHTFRLFFPLVFVSINSAEKMFCLR